MQNVHAIFLSGLVIGKREEATGRKEREKCRLVPSCTLVPSLAVVHYLSLRLLGLIMVAGKLHAAHNILGPQDLRL